MRSSSCLFGKRKKKKENLEKELEDIVSSKLSIAILENIRNWIGKTEAL